MRSTFEISPAGPRPSIRLRPVPRHDPPFDDEVEAQIWASASQLALQWSDRGPRSRTLSEPAVVQEPPAVAGASGDAKLAVRRFVQLCVEVLNGHRPAAHLRRLAHPAEAAAVAAQGMVGAKRLADARRARSDARRPVRRVPPVAVLRLRVCEPRPGAVEAAVALTTGERTWALALRLELHQRSWVATALRLI